MIWSFVIATIFCLIGLIPAFGIFWLIYFLLRRPLQRRERATLFLDLIETGLQTGRSPENSVVTYAQSRDRMLPVRFYLLAAYIETGLKVGAALQKVPDLLPPPLVAMLKVAEETGDIRHMLPVCRRMLNDGISKTQSAINYLVVMAFVFTPLFPFPLAILKIFVIPKWREIFLGYGMQTFPPLTEFVVGRSGWFSGIQTAIVVAVYGAAFVYIGGPRISGWLKRNFSIVVFDSIAFRLPWKRKRMQRDFAGVLALLLDAEVLEDRAVELAAASTANAIFSRRAEKAKRQLASGATLISALSAFDDGEFVWRIRNATQTQGRFATALMGWIESLDAKAFQQEQATAQLATTGLVLLNGLMIALIVTGLFQALIALVNDATLW